MKKWGFIYTTSPTDPDLVRSEAGSPACLLVLRGVPNVDHARRAAEELLAEGVELIELCGAFGPEHQARVLEVTRDRVPLGTVTYACSEAPMLAKLFG